MLEVKSWEKIETEKLNSKIGRKMLTGKNATVAQILLARDAVVPRHSHENEQFTYILSGALKFTFDDQESVVVHGGEVLFIPSNVPHSAVALEDTLDLDIFAPRREDWINKTDSYLRGEE
jgi:quercetin dioxygenase-like cupin family protein